MKPKQFLFSKLLQSFLLIMGLFLLQTLKAQNAVTNKTTTDEATIRNLVEQQNNRKGTLKYTKDRVFVSGALPRPIIGELTEEDKKRYDSLNAVRLNAVAKVNIVRLEVSKSGDIAYEFGNGTVDFDNQKNEHTHINNSYVRVWKKVDGEWLVDIAFFRPNR